MKNFLSKKGLSAMDGKLIGVVIVMFVAGALLPDAITAVENLSGIVKIFFVTLIPLGLGYAIYKWATGKN